ncbi:hypothetical protein EIP86_002721 [Pleurotus ostreatoroseus]|nr:hypothetical protein EIP86_002721 [Pleurotus ostreatoroseus]
MDDLIAGISRVKVEDEEDKETKTGKGKEKAKEVVDKGSKVEDGGDDGDNEADDDDDDDNDDDDDDDDDDDEDEEDDDDDDEEDEGEATSGAQIAEGDVANPSKSNGLRSSETTEQNPSRRAGPYGGVSSSMHAYTQDDIKEFVYEAELNGGDTDIEDDSDIGSMAEGSSPGQPTREAEGSGHDVGDNESSSEDEMEEVKIPVDTDSTTARSTSTSTRPEPQEKVDPKHLGFDTEDEASDVSIDEDGPSEPAVAAETRRYTIQRREYQNYDTSCEEEDVFLTTTMIVVDGPPPNQTSEPTALSVIPSDSDDDMLADDQMQSPSSAMNADATSSNIDMDEDVPDHPITPMFDRPTPYVVTIPQLTLPSIPCPVPAPSFPPPVPTPNFPPPVPTPNFPPPIPTPSFPPPVPTPSLPPSVSTPGLPPSVSTPGLPPPVPVPTLPPPAPTPKLPPPDRRLGQLYTVQDEEGSFQIRREGLRRIPGICHCRQTTSLYLSRIQHSSQRSYTLQYILDRGDSFQHSNIPKTLIPDPHNVLVFKSACESEVPKADGGSNNSVDHVQEADVKVVPEAGPSNRPFARADEMDSHPGQAASDSDLQDSGSVKPALSTSHHTIPATAALSFSEAPAEPTDRVVEVSPETGLSEAHSASRSEPENESPSAPIMSHADDDALPSTTGGSSLPPKLSHDEDPPFPPQDPPHPGGNDLPLDIAYASEDPPLSETASASQDASSAQDHAVLEDPSSKSSPSTSLGSPPETIPVLPKYPLLFARASPPEQTLSPKITLPSSSSSSTASKSLKPSTVCLPAEQTVEPVVARQTEKVSGPTCSVISDRKDDTVGPEPTPHTGGTTTTAKAEDGQSPAEVPESPQTIPAPNATPLTLSTTKFAMPSEGFFYKALHKFMSTRRRKKINPLQAEAPVTTYDLQAHGDKNRAQIRFTSVLHRFKHLMSHNNHSHVVNTLPQAQTRYDGGSTQGRGARHVGLPKFTGRRRWSGYYTAFAAVAFLMFLLPLLLLPLYLVQQKHGECLSIPDSAERARIRLKWQREEQEWQKQRGAFAIEKQGWQKERDAFAEERVRIRLEWQRETQEWQREKQREEKEWQREEQEWQRRRGAFAIEEQEWQKERDAFADERREWTVERAKWQAERQEAMK